MLVQPQTFAFCFALPRLVCAEYSQSKLVVIAKLERKEYFEPEHRDAYYVYSLQTTKTLRGNIGPQFRVIEFNNTGRASFYWIVGSTYLLFLDPTEDGMWSLYGCGNSAPINGAAYALRVINSLSGRRGGVIQGLVADRGGYPAQIDLSGIAIDVRGDAGEFKAVTNRMGEFKLHVPAGRYTVVPSQPGSRFTKDIESFEDPNSITIEDGGGAQLQFRRDT